MNTDAEWVPQACTLPTEDQPLRVAEFDELFATSLRGLDQVEPLGLRMHLEPTPEVAKRAADLVVRETKCCSFFTFALVASNGELRLDITVPEGRGDVLTALASRAAG